MGSDGGSLLILDAAAVAQTLSPRQWLDAAEQALRGTSDGSVTQGVRQTLPLPGPSGRLLSMMFGAAERPACLGAKVISVFPDNFARGLGSHRGGVLLFDPDNGALMALLHGGEITARRTAAASAVATDVLARDDAAVLTVLGYGEQAAQHIDSIALVRPLTEVRCWGRDEEKARAFAASVADRHDLRARMALTVVEAVRGADIVCTTTSAKEPVLRGEWLEPGMHLNVVGSSTADYRELDAAAVARASMWVDFRAMTEVSAGEYLEALREGAIAPTHLIGEIGAVLNGALGGRSGAEEITMFKSLGMAAEDLYAAQMIYLSAAASGIGTRVSL